MDKSYATISDIENYSLLTIDEGFEPQIEDWIVAMSNYVALMTNREWLADTEDTIRYYDGNGYRSQQFDDFISIETLELGESFGENYEEETAFTTYPYNIIPKHTIILKDTHFPVGTRTVKITGRFGYAEEVPKDIVFAVTVLVTGIIQAQTNQEGEIESEKIGNYQVKYTTEQQKKDFTSAMDIIKSRRLIRL